MTILPRPGILYDGCSFSAAGMKLAVWTIRQGCYSRVWALLHLQHSHFMLQCSHSMHPAVLPRENWTNYMSRYLPFRKGSNGADVPFHNSIIGNFIVYQDRIETHLLKLSAHSENSEWFSVTPVIIFEVKLLLNRNKHNWQWFFCFL